tara:strand:+ start:9119 stop:10015 length:897 start_codon:yes stop_codon:yes gene_type:complete
MLKKNLYRNHLGSIYFQKQIKGKSVTLMTHTEDESIANKLHTALEYQAKQTIKNPNKDKNGFEEITFIMLVSKYLTHDHDWSPVYRKTTEKALKEFLVHGIPDGKNWAVVVKKTVNRCINWGLKHRYKTLQPKYIHLHNVKKRKRILNNAEINLILKSSKDEDFRLFVNFAYYTGCRIEELIGLKSYNFYPLHFQVEKDKKIRYVRLNKQARMILEQKEGMWNYTKQQIFRNFYKNTQNLNIDNVKFEDLRFTFGYKLITEQQIPLFKVSKLLGHSAVSITEDHYAPFLNTDVEDFFL